MTLEEKAEEYEKAYSEKCDYMYEHQDIQQAYKDGYKQGAKDIEVLTKENAELKAQIEKMKNMQNCKHNWETKGQCMLKNGGYCVCNKWELAEN